MIQLHLAERLDDLAADLARRLGEPLADPLAPEVVIVPTAAMWRWLSIELSRHLGVSAPGRGDGISANFEMWFPGNLGRVLSVPADGFDPWDLERASWVVLEVLDSSPETVAPRAPGVTAWARARRTADLFDRYMTHRPAMIRSWAIGTDIDGTGRPIDEASRWQPRLWRRVRERIGTPSPPESLPQRLAELRAGGCPDTVPERISLFGLSTIPGGTTLIEQLEALSTQREILLFVHQPSLEVTRRVASTDTATAPPTPYLLRAEDRSSDLVTHPLLSSWGRPAREAAVLLGDGCATATSTPAPRSEPAVTLLTRLQHDLRTDTAPNGSFEPHPDDRSLIIHSCHGNTRQVEILRDQILHLLTDDPTLSEDDIVVFCPALTTFAPVIEAVLGPPGDPVAHLDEPPLGAPRLRYRLSDRSLGSTHPMLSALGALLELLASRFSDRAVLEFASLDPVRRRHGFDDDDLGTISGWIVAANTRWGIDGHHREQWGLPAGYETGSWRRGIDRLLMGIAIHDRASTMAPGSLVPIGVEGSTTALAGRFADMIDRLAGLQALATDTMPVHRWIDLLRDAITALFAADPDNPWEAQRLNSVLARIEDTSLLTDGAAGPEGGAATRRCEVDLALDDIRHLIGAELVTATGRSDFFRGGVTICTPTPLRAVPHRVICLLGMDDSAFPVAPVDGDDLVATEPQLGDRDRRAESRHVLLDCVLAARDHLILLRNGQDVVTNREIPVAVPVAELIESISATVDPTHRVRFLEQLTVEHPRQRFDEINFRTDTLPADDSVPPSVQLGLDRPWSFDPSDFAGASAHRRGLAPDRFVRQPLAAFHPVTIALEDLREFLAHPPRYFLKRVLEIDLPKAPERDDASGLRTTGSSNLPMAAPGRNLLVELDNLERWGLRQDLLTHRRLGGDLDSFTELRFASDLLPPGPLADEALAEASEIVEPMISELRDLCDPTATPEHVRIDLELGSGVRIVGSVRDDRGRSPGPITVGMSSLKAKHLLNAWLDALVLTAARPGVAWHAVHIAKDRRNRPDVRTFTITDPDGGGPPELDLAIGALEVVVELFLRGHREPLPLFPALSHALYRTPKSAAGKWESGYGSERSDGDDDWIRVAFDDADYRTITSLAVRDDDPDCDGDDRATRYARYLWDTVEHSSPGTKLTL